MIYKGYDILLERHQCEFWTLDDEGGSNEYVRDCPDSTHTGLFRYIAFNEVGKRICTAETLESLKAYLDKVAA